jgi:type IV pilus assembly protein PilN
MRFTINLALKTRYDRLLVGRTITVVGIMLFLLLAWNVYRLIWNQGEIVRLDGDISYAGKRLKSYPKGVSDKDYSRMLADVGFYNDIIARKVFNWVDLLEKLEEVTPEGIALSSLLPDREKGTLKIEAWAASFQDIRSYMAKLEDSGEFTDVLLLSNQTVQLWEQARGIKFSVSCRVKIS